MKILVDADACPVKKNIEYIASLYAIPVTMYIDSSHVLESEYSSVVIVDKGIDSVDLKILKDLEVNDIVVTQDFGLASLALSKGASVINQNGLVFNEFNIERLLFERHLSAESRRRGNRSKYISKRKNSDDEIFEKAFLDIVKKSL